MDQTKFLKPSLQKRQKRRDKRMREELVECYRGGLRVKTKNNYTNKVTRNLFENAKQKERMKDMCDGGTKHFNENLGPLRRFLLSKVGESWDDVYAELNKHLDRNSVLGLHVIQHLFREVHRHVVIRKGKVFVMSYGKERELIYSGRWPKYYVCPETGLLKKARNQKRPRGKNYHA